MAGAARRLILLGALLGPAPAAAEPADCHRASTDACLCISEGAAARLGWPAEPGCGVPPPGCRCRPQDAPGRTEASPPCLDPSAPSPYAPEGAGGPQSATYVGECVCAAAEAVGRLEARLGLTVDRRHECNASPPPGEVCLPESVADLVLAAAEADRQVPDLKAGWTGLIAGAVLVAAILLNWLLWAKG